MTPSETSNTERQTVIFQEHTNFGCAGGVLMCWLHEPWPGHWELLTSRWRPE